MNNKILYFFAKLTIASAAVLSLLACHENFEDKGIPSLELSPADKELVFTESGSQTIAIKTNRDWKAFFESPKDWIELSKTEGSGDDEITLTVASGAKQESATLTIALYNQYGIMMSESIAITRNGDGSPVRWFEFDWATALTSNWQNDTVAEANGIEWYINGMNTSTYGNIGFSYFNQEGGYIYNKTAIGTKITEIIVDLQEAADLNNITLYAGSAEHPAAGSEAVTGVLEGDLVTYTLEGETPYFTLQNSSTGYLNIDGFEVSYDGDINSEGGNEGGNEGGDDTTPTLTTLFTLDDDALGIEAALVNESKSSTVSGIEFESKNIGYASAYGTMYIDVETAGHIRNLTAFDKEFVSVVVTGGYSIADDLTVTVGESADAVDQVVKYSSKTGSSWDTQVEYKLPANAKFIKFTSNTEVNKDAALSKIAFNVNE